MNLKLWWNRLWIRKDEFHKSLDIDAERLVKMTDDERDKYMDDLMKRRNIAHNRDIE